MIHKFFLIFFLSLFLTNLANSKEHLENKPLNSASNTELLNLVEAQKETIKKQAQISERLDAHYIKFKKEVDDHKIGQQYMNYPIWISILLGCATFIITAVAVIVAIVSIFGYKHIKESASDIASKKAKEVATIAVTSQVQSQLPTIAIEEIKAGSIINYKMLLI